MKIRISRAAIAVAKTSICGLAYGAGLYIGMYIVEFFLLGVIIPFNFKEFVLSSLFGWLLVVIVITVILLVTKVVRKILKDE